MWLNYLDPIYLILRYGLMRKFLKADLAAKDKLFIHENINKHRLVLWLNVPCAYLAVSGLKQVQDAGNMFMVLLGLVMVFGGAWYQVSFGKIPETIKRIGMDITFFMFLAFTVSLSTMFVALLVTTPQIMWPIWALTYVCALMSCILYDTADGLVTGLEKAILRSSVLACRFYVAMGVEEQDADQ